MHNLTRRVVLLIFYSVLSVPGHVLLLAGQGAVQESLELRAPATERPVKIDLSGQTILPNGRLITPLGSHVKVAPHPYGLALSPDGKTLVTANSGTHPFSASIITKLDTCLSPKLRTYLK